MAIPAEKLIRIHKEGGADSSQALETLAVLAEDDEITSQTAPSAFYVGSYCLHLFSKDRSAVHLARLALKYLEKAGNTPEAIYTRGILEVYMEDNDAAKPYLMEARKLGISQADVVLKEISVNRNVYKMKNNN